jgi:hypothetical protein
MAVGLIVAGHGSAKIEPATCVGAWLFDDSKGDTAEDLSGNGNEGEIMEGAEWTDGRFGGALDFEGGVNAGNAHVLCGNDASINEIADAITIVAWVFPRQESNYEYVVSNDRDCCGQYKGYSLSLGYTGFQIWDESNVSHKTNLVSKPSLEEWCHLAGTFDGKQLRIYLNGELSNTSAFSGKIGTPASFAFAIGGLGFNPGTYNINGIIDEVAIFNVALADNDIETIMIMGLEKVLGGTAVSPSGRLAATWAEIREIEDGI